MSRNATITIAVTINGEFSHFEDRRNTIGGHANMVRRIEERVGARVRRVVGEDGRTWEMADGTVVEISGPMVRTVAGMMVA